ncbi:hypothetical protein LP52_02435 [Streptomonospora alba]|uniref:Uncharacterized protein n=2 Tax=Streptomonospora alba TaxID=183763 RepID=A0A0C2JTL1_9ACTN|nr:hypothetical protein LP52_02435 [Streptomonospora alba]
MFRYAVREVFRNSLHAYRHAQSLGALFLSRIDSAPNNTPFVHSNDVRSIVPMDEPKRADRPVVPAAADKPVMTETVPGYATGATLNLGVGAMQGSSRHPILRVETDLLPVEGVSLLLERMNRILAGALPAPSTGSKAR